LAEHSVANDEEKKEKTRQGPQPTEFGCHNGMAGPSICSDTIDVAQESTAIFKSPKREGGARLRTISIPSAHEAFSAQGLACWFKPTGSA
jgi:hypothetical protein